MQTKRNFLGVLFAMLMLLFAGNAHAFTCEANSGVREYVVQKNDTLSHIALCFKTSVSLLQRINRIANADIIYPKQRLEISPQVRRLGVIPHSTEIRMRKANASATNTPRNNTNSEVGTSLDRRQVKAFTIHGQPKKATQNKRAGTAETTARYTPMHGVRTATTVLLQRSERMLPSPETKYERYLHVDPMVSDVRHNERLRIRRFLMTYLGPPYDLPYMEKVLLEQLHPPTNPTPFFHLSHTGVLND